MDHEDVILEILNAAPTVTDAELLVLERLLVELDQFPRGNLIFLRLEADMRDAYETFARLGIATLRENRRLAPPEPKKGA